MNTLLRAINDLLVSKNATGVSASEIVAVVRRHTADAAPKGRRRTWAEAAEMAKRVHAVRRNNPSMTEADVAAEVGLSRPMVAYYLHNPKHAP